MLHLNSLTVKVGLNSHRLGLSSKVFQCKPGGKGGGKIGFPLIIPQFQCTPEREREEVSEIFMGKVNEKGEEERERERMKGG